ncbi:Gas vesicle protein [Frankia sp. CeD]|nr:Gas vesicle protein [Frankia sp. CeD]
MVLSEDGMVAAMTELGEVLVPRGGHAGTGRCAGAGCFGGPGETGSPRPPRRVEGPLRLLRGRRTMEEGEDSAMTVSSQSMNRAPKPSSLADVLDVVLDRGIVIDAYARVALVGIEVLTADARVVIATVDTYLRFAEAVNRLDLAPKEQVPGLPGLMHEVTDGTARQKSKGALEGLKDTAEEAVGSLRGGSSEEHARRDLPAGRSAPGDRRSGREG